MALSYQDTAASSWFSPLELESRSADLLEGGSAFVRLWRGFMTARVMIAMALLLLQGSIYVLGQAVPGWLILLCMVYLAESLGVRVLSNPRSHGRRLDPQWIPTIAADILVFSVLQFLQAGGINYTPLYALPVLLAAVLGSRALALLTAAGVTLLLLTSAGWRAVLAPADSAFHFLQAGMTGSGLLIIAWLANELASRLVREERTARRNQVEAQAQKLVNELVIENLTDGVLVIDALNVVRAANPSARQLLGRDHPAPHAPFTLNAEPAWAPLAELARATFAKEAGQTADLLIQHADHARCHLQARTQLTTALAEQLSTLCVMFLQDLREMEARLRTEKLAAMGRMSAAVAHEIRNPLAAISQANALLDEELGDPRQKQLTHMVSQNARRLAQIVDEVLDIARVQHLQTAAPGSVIRLDEAVAATCRDWTQQTANGRALQLNLQAGPQPVSFAADHLHRVMVNLLDNALRYASQKDGAIQVSTQVLTTGQAILKVWSDGAPLENTVQRHLFEPFFSSESRSSGLGLFICRQLCERHGAMIGHERTTRRRATGRTEGNEFFVAFRHAAPLTPA